jgi:hypothetical protein
MMKKHDRPNTGPALLSDREWAALKSICQARSNQAEERGRASP